MKKYITLLIFSLLTFTGLSQDNGITYQAVIYNPNGQSLPGEDDTLSPLVETDICLKFSIVGNGLEYEETVQTTTDKFGMVNLKIGTNTQTGGSASSLQDIDWDSGEKSMRVELNAVGNCNSFVQISYQTFSYVPFAYYAINEGNTSDISALEEALAENTAADAEESAAGDAADQALQEAIDANAAADAEESEAGAAALQAAIDANAAADAEESAAGTAADLAIQAIVEGAIVEATAAITANSVAIATTQADVDQNEADSDAADAILQATIDAAVAEATAAITANVIAIATTQADVDQNEADSDAADAALQAIIDAAIAEATAAITANGVAIAITQADVDQNEADGDAADAALQAAIDANAAADAEESAAGDAADAALQAAIDAVEDAAVTQLSELSDVLVENNSLFVGNDPSATTNTAQANVSLGLTALDEITSGDRNTAVGHNALTEAKAGVNNVAMGYNTLNNVTSGNYNVGIGNSAGSNVVGGSGNVFIGNNANTGSNQAGPANRIAIGSAANVTQNNTAVIGNDLVTGVYMNEEGQAMVYAKGITFGDNTSMETAAASAADTQSADQALQDAIDANAAADAEESAAGDAADAALQDAIDNLSVNDLSDGMSSNGNIALGSILSQNNGNDNTVLGIGAMSSAVGAIQNTAIGRNTLSSNTSGLQNIAIGFHAMNAGATGNVNVAVGSGALEMNVQDANVAIGYYSLGANTSGNGNTAVGTISGNSVTTGHSNSLFGYSAQPSSPEGVNQTALGFDAKGQEDNSVTLGNSNVNSIYASQDGEAIVYAGGITFSDGTQMTTAADSADDTQAAIDANAAADAEESAAGDAADQAIVDSLDNLDLSVAGDNGVFNVDVYSGDNSPEETLLIIGTNNEVETDGSTDNQIQIGLPDNVVITGNLVVGGEISSPTIDDLLSTISELSEQVSALSEQVSALEELHVPVISASAGLSYSFNLSTFDYLCPNPDETAFINAVIALVEFPSATDLDDGDLTGTIESETDITNFAPGSYTISYNVTDSDGNAAEELVQSIEITDDVAPVITISDNAITSLVVGGDFEVADASANDCVDGEVEFSVTSDVDTNTAGSYTVTYTATDSSGNTSSESYGVTVTATVLVSESYAINSMDPSVFTDPFWTFNEGPGCDPDEFYYCMFMGNDHVEVTIPSDAYTATPSSIEVSVTFDYLDWYYDLDTGDLGPSMYLSINGQEKELAYSGIEYYCEGAPGAWLTVTYELEVDQASWSNSNKLYIWNSCFVLAPNADGNYIELTFNY